MSLFTAVPRKAPLFNCPECGAVVTEVTSSRHAEYHANEGRVARIMSAYIGSLFAMGTDDPEHIAAAAVELQEATAGLLKTEDADRFDTVVAGLRAMTGKGAK